MRDIVWKSSFLWGPNRGVKASNGACPCPRLRTCRPALSRARSRLGPEGNALTFCGFGTGAIWPSRGAPREDGGLRLSCSKPCKSRAPKKRHGIGCATAAWTCAAPAALGESTEATCGQSRCEAHKAAEHGARGRHFAGRRARGNGRSADRGHKVAADREAARSDGRGDCDEGCTDHRRAEERHDDAL